MSDKLTHEGLQRPRQVSMAVSLLWLGLGLGIVNFFLEWGYWTSLGHSLKWMFIGQITFVGAFGWAMYMVWLGRNWARIVTLAMAIFKVLSLLQLSDAFQRSFVAGSISVLQLLVFLSAVFLLYTQPGRAWFQMPNNTMEPTR